MAEEDIRDVVSMWTGIPLTRIASEESARLLEMEASLKAKVIGQDEAVEALAKAVRRARAGLKDPKRPIGTFMFLGPTGVGKTYLAESAGRVHVRVEGQHRPPRHVRVHGEAHGLATGGLASGLRGLRRRRSADGPGAPARRTA